MPLIFVLKLFTHKKSKKMALEFRHTKDWGGGSSETEDAWVPVDPSGKTVPHLFGHLMVVGSRWGEWHLPNWQHFDLYRTLEKSFSKPSFFGTQEWVEVTGFQKTSPFESAKDDTIWLCPSGIYGEHYEAYHLDADPVAGLFLVPKGTKVGWMSHTHRGNSCFPGVFHLEKR